jgi:hypothetical protein
MQFQGWALGLPSIRVMTKRRDSSDPAANFGPSPLPPNVRAPFAMSLSKKSERNPRPTTCQFNVEDLYKKWEPLAQLRRPGYKWDCSTYEAQSRTQSAHIPGLVAHAPALKALLGLAPSGFPSHKLLRLTLFQLAEKYTIFEDVPPRLHWKCASEAADVWKVVCRHVYELRKKGCQCPLT